MSEPDMPEEAEGRQLHYVPDQREGEAMTTHRYPPAVVEAAAMALHDNWVSWSLRENDCTLPSDHPTWNDLEDYEREARASEATAALDAAFAAWPGMEEVDCMWRGGGIGAAIILPLAND